MIIRFTSIFHRLLWSYSAIFLLLFSVIFLGIFIKMSVHQVHISIMQLRQATLSDRERLELELFHTQTNLKSWATLSVMDDLLTDDIDQRITRELEKFKQQYQLKGHLYALSAKGLLMTADHEINQNLDISIWFSHIKNNVSFIDKHSNPIDGTEIIALWQPIKASFNEQQTIGYLLITYPWQNITQFLADNTLLRHLMLFDRAGTCVHQDKHLPLMSNIALVNANKKSSLYSQIITQYIEITHDNHYEVFMDQQSFFVEALADNVNMPLTNAWHWVAFAPTQQVYAPIKKIVLDILKFAIVIISFAFFILYLLSQHLSRPIQVLTQFASEIANTLDLSKRLPYQGQDEIAKLASSFNNMCDKLEKTWDEKNQINDDLQTLNTQLEHKVAERTEHLAWQAHHDILTGLPNRALLSKCLASAIAKSQQNNSLLAVIFIDLDGFKAVNDNFGHNIGDKLLIHIAKNFLKNVREPDTVARLGGDEFVVLLSLQRLEDINAPLQRICTFINEPVIIDQYTLKVSPSIGVTIYPLDSADSDSLIRHADQAMYHAKHKGRNQIQFFNKKM